MQYVLPPEKVWLVIAKVSKVNLHSFSNGTLLRSEKPKEAAGRSLVGVQK